MASYMRVIEKQLKNKKFSLLLTNMLNHNKEMVIDHLYNFQVKRHRIRKVNYQVMSNLLDNFERDFKTWVISYDMPQKFKDVSIILQDELNKYFSPESSIVKYSHSLRVAIMMCFFCLEEILASNMKLLIRFRKMYRYLYYYGGVKLTAYFINIILSNVRIDFIIM